MPSTHLSYNVTVIEWITHSIKHFMTTSYITLSAGTSNLMNEDVLDNSANFHCNETNFKGDKITFKRKYDKQNLTLVIIS